MSVINTNVKSLIAQNAAVVNDRSLSKAMQQLSTGKRINGAADDAAGLAISDRMTSQIRGLNQAVRNANDGISMLQTTEGALNEITNMLQRMRELAVQSTNATNTSTDRNYLQLEHAELQAEILRVANNTQWNGMNVTNSTAATNLTGAGFQVGANASQTISHDFVDVGVTVVSASVAGGITLSTASNANTAISTIDGSIAAVDSYRATLGAKINRLTHAADNLTNVATNAQASRSRILDTDYAQTTTELARTQIIQQAATAMLAQANQQPSTVLSLLK